MRKYHRIPFVLGLAALLFVFPFLITDVFSQSGYFTSQGCSGCHSSPVVATCNGCHAHGVHSSSAKNNINVAGATNKTSYAPGETVTVTITGGYRTGWIRAALFDQSGTEIARSTGNASGVGSSTTYPATLSAPAPATPGTYTWKAAWYGNQNDAGGATFGAGWVPDGTNPEHGYETVNTNSFTVVAAVAAPTITSVAPNSLTQGAVNQSITITGTNLTGGAVSFSNAGVTGGTPVISATSITLPVSVTAGAATGAGTVSVTTSGGSVSSAFTVTASPQNLLSVTMGGTGTGSVNSNPSGVACSSGSSAGCSAAFSATASVALTESPGNGSVFGGWTGDCGSFGTAATCTVSMAAARNVTATFNPSPPVAMIGTTGYVTLNAAYAAAAGGATIKIIDSNIAGDLTIDKIVTFDGGYDATLLVKAGAPTVLAGVITVSTGSFTSSDIAIM